MPENPDSSLQERVERLEAVVADLQSELRQTQEASRQKERKETGFPAKGRDRAQARPSSTEPFPASPVPGRKKSFALPENMRTIEYWLNKIGIGLLLFGIAFLFKYSVDQGWLTPSVRVGIGVGLGIGLVVAGLRISSERQHFSQVLIGGGLTAFYISGFAAFQLFQLISYPVAFAFMVLATLLAFMLAVSRDGMVLALIGAVGGLGTPFLLYTDAGNLPGLVGYTCLILAGTSAIFFYRGWRTLLWTSLAGGWLVLIAAIVQLPSPTTTAPLGDRWAVQAGVVFVWLAFWALPLIREYLRAGEATAIHDSSPAEEAPSPFARQRHLHLLSVSTPLISLWLSMGVWSLANPTWGWIALGGALLYGLVARWLAVDRVIEHISFTHALVSVLLLTNAFVLMFVDETLLFVLAGEAAILHLVAHRLADRRIAFSAHLLTGLIFMALFERLFDGRAQGTAVFNARALVDLWIVGTASMVSFRILTGTMKRLYLVLLHIAVLGWFLREFASLPDGQAYVTIAWGIYALILFVFALRMRLDRLRTVAMGTLLLVVGKLFIVDLSELQTIWRVLLFMGFGGLFLLLSYYFRTLWKSDDEVVTP